MKKKRLLVPAAPVVRAVSAWLAVEWAEYEQEGPCSFEGVSGKRSWCHVRRCTPTRALSEAVGMKPDTLEKLLKKRYPRMCFDTADRLITASVGPEAWYSDPELAEIYQSVNLREKT